MRFLIVAAVLACAAAAPSGLLAAPYAHGFVGHAGLAVAHAAPFAVAAPLAVAAPTISPGDIAGAAIDAHVNANDHARAAVDAVRELNDKAAELHGEAVNTAVENSWQAVDAVKTAEAQIDGAAAGVSPVLAKHVVGAAPVAAYGVAAGYAAHGVVAAPAVAAYAAPYAAHYAAVGHAAPLAVAHGAYAHGLRAW